METSIKEFQQEIAGILNSDEWFGQHGIDWLPEDTLNVEYEIKKNLGQTGMVAVVTTPSLDYQGEHKSTATVKNYTETKDGNTTVWTIPDEQDRSIEVTQVKTVTPTKPYDEILEYVEFTGSTAEGEQWINTGINLSNGLRIESEWTRVVTTLANMTFFGARTGDSNQALFGMNRGGTNIYYQKNYALVTITAPTTDLGLSYTVDFVNGVMDVNGQTKSIDAPGSFNIPLFIGATNSNGSAMFRTERGTRFKSMKIYDGGSLVRDFVPAKKNGVACLFDKVSGQLYYTANQGGRDFIAGPTVEVAPTTVTYSYKVAGGCIPSGLDFTVTPGQTREEIVGDSRYETLLTMDGDVVPTAVSMSKRTSALIGKPFDAFVETCTNYPVNDLPYDAEIEYLQSTGTQYINTGINYEPGIRVELDVAMGATGTVPIFGARTTANTSKCYAAFYYNTTSSHSRAIRFDYCASNTATPDKTQNYTPNNSIPSLTQVSLTFNGPTLTYPDGTVTATLDDQTFSTDYPMYLFAVNTGGTATLAESTLNIYGCRIYDGEHLLRDFVPVRVGQVAYLYDRVSGNLFGNEGTGSFVLGDDTLVNHRYGIVDTGITPDENTDMELELYGSENVSVVQVVAGTRTAPNRNCYCVGFYMPNYSNANTRGRARYDWGANSAATVDMYSYFNFPVTIGYKEKRRYMNGAGSTAYTIAAPDLSDLPVWLYCWNLNNDTQRATFTTNHAWMTLGKVRFWQNGTLVAELIPVSKDGVGMYWDTVAQQLHSSLTAPLTAGTVIPTPETTDESSATFTEDVEQVNKGFDVEVSLQVVENPTVNRGKPDTDKIATALDVAHRAIYTLAGYDTEHFNEFSPSTVRQTTVSSAGNKLLQVDARFRATPIL